MSLPHPTPKQSVEGSAKRKAEEPKQCTPSSQPVKKVSKQASPHIPHM